MFYSAEDVLKVMSDEDSNSDCYDDSVTSESDDEYAVEIFFYTLCLAIFK